MSVEKRYKICAGIDFQKEVPNVCFWAAQMKEPEPLSLDFSGCTDHKGCFRKILSALKRYEEKDKICAAIILPDLSPQEISQYERDACEAGFLPEQLLILGEEECLAHFVMHQSNDIWQHQVWYLEFGTEEIKARMIQVNKRSRPMLVQVLPPAYWYVGSLESRERDDRLLEAVRENIVNNQVSAVFVTGTDLNENDYKKSREALCSLRRVFLGEQITARGACMVAREKEQNKPYLFLNEQTLLYNLGVAGIQEGEEITYTIVRAGCNWYEAKKSCEVILQGDAALDFSFCPMSGGEAIHKEMILTDFPTRPNGATRLLLEVCFHSPLQCEIKVTDLGFGEMYPASELCWTESYRIGEEEEDGTGYAL